MIDDTEVETYIHMWHTLAHKIIVMRACNKLDHVQAEDIISSEL